MEKREQSRSKSDRLILGFLVVIIVLLLMLQFRSRHDEIGIGIGDQISLINPETKKELPLKDCGQDCQIFNFQNRIIGTTTAQIIDTERVGSATCCTTVTETSVQEGVATSSTMETCCFFPEKNQCKPNWWKRPGYAHPQSCTTTFH